MTKYTEEEIAEHRRLWLEALRSGEFGQVKSLLGRVDANGDVGYCCLGVACEVAIKNGLDLTRNVVVEYPDTEEERTIVVYGKEREHLTLPLPVAEWLGLGAETSPELVVAYNEDSETYGEERLPERNLTSLNDGAGFTFEQIAAAVEKYGLRASDPVALPAL